MAPKKTIKEVLEIAMTLKGMSAAKNAETGKRKKEDEQVKT